ncbi:cell wall hydrolase [Parageobacillus thermoglucosidasius]|uniref:Peptigoglycan-binding protein LysM n=1 Tax=Parageobacillus thermoglucosidasius TaxID=1426 RepID=A0AAN0YP32_PARTM|nr:cell wall hydrolase [Parageobacillus thermoglucosidasius]ALF10285.1 peptigoglycan-binding protein LysM [Parageobacillus thermoglucosidasius]ANZ30366.1 peptigoglycan-binding protein LysM [Parageobacillus thermoglucosidasius]APM81104.1 peptigoglycan-binding protein LysM [Parageobacillus thermoglucosidasius]KJX68534.1 peptigoglycan-binding protein LysM [Parageobacillus thermoglucosidasius]RDE21695.1 LysM peptidoglycan-binding domain-containing protein [Parageobacillus thermoglucosidasius]
MIKKTFAALAVVCCIVSGISSYSTDAATTYTYYKVKKGDTLFKIAKTYKTTVSALKSLNRRKSDVLIAGETIKVPRLAVKSAGQKQEFSISAAERKLMAQLVHAETGFSEPFAGKVEVALVILNRMKHPAFPKTIKGVIYQKTKSGYAFVPVRTGKLTRIQPTKQDYAAVDRALSLFPNDRRGSLYFYNPKITKDKWMLSRPVTIRIGNHVFTK